MREHCQRCRSLSASTSPFKDKKYKEKFGEGKYCLPCKMVMIEKEANRE